MLFLCNRINLYSVLVENEISRVCVSLFLCVCKRLIRPDLGFTIVSGLSYPVNSFARLWGFCVACWATSEAFIYSVCNLIMKIIQIISRTSLGGKPAVNRHILLINLSDKSLVCLPFKSLNVVTLTNIH